MNKRDVAKELILRKFQERDRILHEIDEIVDEFLEDRGSWYHIDYFWGCDESPFGWCAFHRMEDPAHDHCIFCENPLERK